MQIALYPPLIGLIGLLAAGVMYLIVKRYPEGDESLREIAETIHQGAMVFMRREYTNLVLFALVLLVILWIFLGMETALAFLAGALSSAAAGWLGMYTATRANVRTTTAAHTKGMQEALSVAFFGGSIMGLAVAALGLIGLGTVYYFFGGDPADRRAYSRLRHGRFGGGTLLACGRRYLYQERGCRGGSRWKNRSGHSRG